MDAVPAGLEDPDFMTLLPTLLGLTALDDLPRTGWILRGVKAPESVAGHVLGTAHVALALVPRERIGLDLGRVLAMALVHDAPEALCGDLPRPASEALPAGAKAAMETKLAARVVAPLSPVAEAAWNEYVEQGTPESRFVRLCDRLQLGVRLVGYERAGYKGLEEFRSGLSQLDCGEFQACRALLDEILAG